MKMSAKLFILFTSVLNACVLNHTWYCLR